MVSCNTSFCRKTGTAFALFKTGDKIQKYNTFSNCSSTAWFNIAGGKILYRFEVYIDIMKGSEDNMNFLNSGQRYVNNDLFINVKVPLTPVSSLLFHSCYFFNCDFQSTSGLSKINSIPSTPTYSVKNAYKCIIYEFTGSSHKNNELFVTPLIVHFLFKF